MMKSSFISALDDTVGGTDSVHAGVPVTSTHTETPVMDAGSQCGLQTTPPVALNKKEKKSCLQLNVLPTKTGEDIKCMIFKTGTGSRAQHHAVPLYPKYTAQYLGPKVVGTWISIQQTEGWIVEFIKKTTSSCQRTKLQNVVPALRALIKEKINAARLSAMTSLDDSEDDDDDNDAKVHTIMRKTPTIVIISRATISRA